MVDFTVAIPTYNGENRVPDVLERLRSQIGTEDFSWEIIVVDNKSTDRTHRIIEDYQRNWDYPFPLRYLLEPRQGAAFARQTAVENAKGQFIGFLDDDNLPSPTWVAAAYRFGLAHPNAGAYGSRIQGDFEVIPAIDNFNKIAPFLALTERGSQPCRYEPHRKMLPPGAGLTVRRQAWLEAVPKSLFLNNAGKAVGLASEDLEAGLYLQKAGWEIWYNPEMEVRHKIPAWRLEKDYLLSLFRCVGLSRHHIRMLSLEPWQRPLLFPLYWLNDLRQLLQLQHRYRQTQDLVTACEIELFSNSLISPFFLWKRRLSGLFNSLSIYDSRTKLIGG